MCVCVCVCVLVSLNNDRAAIDCGTFSHCVIIIQQIFYPAIFVVRFLLLVVKTRFCHSGVSLLELSKRLF